MIHDFIFSANAVFPIFIVIAFGYVLRRKQYLSATAVAELNRLVFSFALPMLLFRNVYQADFATLFDPRLVLWIVGSLILWFVLIWIFAEFFLRKQQDLISAFVQASFRANYAIVGLPLIANILGDADTGKASIAAAIVVLMFNLLSVIVLTAKNAESSGFNFALFKSIAFSIITNPSIIGVGLGIAVNLLNIPLPWIAREAVRYMAILCTPVALLAIGGSVQVSELKKYFKPALLGSAIKIIIAPIAFMLASIWLDFRGEDLLILFVMYANPTAIVSYAMAVRMNAHAPITATIVILTTVFSSLTLTVGIFLLRIFSLI